MLRLYSTPAGLIVERDGAFFPVPQALTLDALFSAADPEALLLAALLDARPIAGGVHEGTFLAPLQSQEVWAAGVTYYRSRTARMAESKDSGGDTFYDKVYEADRPEIFFKATPHRVAAPGGGVRIRSDSRWNVPEPELHKKTHNRNAKSRKLPTPKLWRVAEQTKL